VAGSAKSGGVCKEWRGLQRVAGVALLGIVPLYLVPSQVSAQILAVYPPNLVSTPLATNQIKLSWSPAGNGTSYKVYRKTGVAGTWAEIATTSGSATSHTDVTVVANTEYFYRVRMFYYNTGSPDSNTVSSMIVNSNTTIENFPSYIAVYPTSGSSNRIYWSELPSATSYKIYRSTSPDVASYATTPVATVMSGNHFFDNSNLTTDQKYYYCVRAVVNNVLTSPSQEDNASPNYSAIPWHLSPGQILSATRQQFTYNIDVWDPDEFDSTPITVVAPDGVVYDDSSSVPIPKISTFNPIQRTMTLNNVVMPVSDDFFAPGNNTVSGNSPIILSTTSSVSLVEPPILAPGTDPGSMGAMRRVRSVPLNSTASEVGVEGIYKLPRQSNLNYGSGNGVVNPHIYIGLSGEALEIDAGLQLVRSGQYDVNVNRWNPFLRINDATARPNDNYIQPTPGRIGYLRGFYGIYKSSYFGIGANFGYPQYAHMRLTANEGAKIVNFAIKMGYDKFNIIDTTLYKAIYVSAYSNKRVLGHDPLLPIPKPRAKRVVSLDQRWAIPAAPPVPVPITNATGMQATQGYLSGTSFMNNVEWSDGSVINDFASEWNEGWMLPLPTTPITYVPAFPDVTPNYYASRLPTQTGAQILAATLGLDNGDSPNGSVTNERISITHTQF
jgi:hypothetical protein